MPHSTHQELESSIHIFSLWKYYKYKNDLSENVCKWKYLDNYI